MIRRFQLALYRPNNKTQIKHFYPPPSPSSINFTSMFGKEFMHEVHDRLLIRLAPVLKIIFHQCVISDTLIKIVLRTGASLAFNIRRQVLATFWRFLLLVLQTAYNLLGIFLSARYFHDLILFKNSLVKKKISSSSELLIKIDCSDVSCKEDQITSAQRK